MLDFFCGSSLLFKQIQREAFSCFFHSELYFQFSDNFLIFFQFSKFSDNAKKFRVGKYFL